MQQTQEQQHIKRQAQGSLQTTGRDTDLAIDGDGFFTVEIGPNQKGYTRDGSFSLDMNGNLVTSQGYKVLGEGDNPILIPEEVENANGVNQKVVSFNIASDGSISYLLADGTKMPQLDQYSKMMKVQSNLEEIYMEKLQTQANQ